MIKFMLSILVGVAIAVVGILIGNLFGIKPTTSEIFVVYFAASFATKISSAIGEY